MILRRVLWVGLGVVAVLSLLIAIAGSGWLGSHEGPGEITAAPAPASTPQRRPILNLPQLRKPLR